MFSFSHMLRDSTYIYVVYIKASGVKPPLQIHGSLNSHAGLPPQNESPSLSKLCGTSFLSTDALPRERRPLFTHPEVVQPLISLLGETAQAHFFDVYAYWFMPDHCHAILCGLSPICDLSWVVRASKGRATVTLRKRGIQDLWQSGYHGHVIRNDDDLRASAGYVLENPVRAGLVKDPLDWPFSGSSVFSWNPPL